jgi:hypothetical protein
LITKAEASESERAWIAFIDWLAENEEKFSGRVAGQRYGYKELNDLYVIRNVVNNFLAENYSNSSKIINEWGLSGKICSFPENGKIRYDIRYKRINGSQPRVIKLNPQQVEMNPLEPTNKTQ